MTTICEHNRVSIGAQTRTVGDLARAAAERLAGRDVTSARTVFVVDAMASALGWVAHGVAAGLDFGVIERSRLSPEVIERFVESGVHLIDGETGAPIGGAAAAREGTAPGRITVLTSGTTGLLKLIPHTAETINTFDRVQSLPPNQWFVPYQIGSYAWYQMVALCLFKDEQGLSAGDFSDIASSFEDALRRGAVTAISSTPTFWRHVFMSVDPEVLEAAPLRSVSLGGEIVDQSILDRLAALYPNAKIRHIYASSEAGAAIVVSDGKAGFDAAMLERADAVVKVKVEDGRLYIQSPYANRADAGGWVDTGDLVERRGDRFYFLGRAGNTMINVGGQKAFPADIEAHLMRHPDVLWAKVTARKAPFMGALPAAEIVLRRAIEPDAAERLLTAHCEAGLADYAVPRLWVFHDAVPMRNSLKS